MACGQTHEQTAAPEPFSEAVVQHLMGVVRDGLVAHNSEKMLSALTAMPDYSQFREQVQAFFNRYENFRVYYRVVEAEAVDCPQTGHNGGACGRAVIEMQLQGDDPRNATPGITRTRQLHVTFERLRGGWAISDVEREFFL